MKNSRMCYICLVICLLFVLVLMYKPDIAVSQQDAITDPFEDLPGQPLPNCDKECRFKYDVQIKTVDEFITFLKQYQFDGDLVSYKPEREKLIPSHTYSSLGKKLKIDLEDLKSSVKVLDIGKSLLSNKKIYKLDITYQYFDKESWPWWITVQASDKGFVSIVYCAGK
jgi:hypothetical protein